MNEAVAHADEYRFGRTLYVGPETRVVRAAAPSGEPVILKLSQSAPPTSVQVGRIRHEAAVLATLAGIEGVARLRSTEEVSGHIALVLDDAGPWSLAQALRERVRLPVETALRIAHQVASALDRIHQAAIVHKDVKPQNLVVSQDLTRAVLVDFGLASRLAFEATNASIPEALEGTLAYISPEQTGRTARTLDGRADLYSLGVTLFEMLTGRRPFEESDPLAIVHAHLAVAPPAVEALGVVAPRAVSLLVSHLLAKAPEDRYQTAKGLAHDLELILGALERGERVDDFPLGQRDFSPKLRLPETLIGRDDEMRVVTESFLRAANGGVELLLVGGPSGIGKSALVRSVYQDIARQKTGLLLAGKHDELARSTPYVALSQAFGGLMSNIAASPRPTFDRWKGEFASALGANARVIADVVPELEWVTGELGPVPEVPTEMAYNRVKLTWLELVRAVTEASPPLVLFLDDMQWADASSLELLKVLLTDVGRARLLVIAAYRDDGVDAAHPLWSLVDVSKRAGVSIPRVHLEPLSESMVAKWLAVTLDTEPARVAPLADVLRRKTDGNPFFLGQLLLELTSRRMVHRDLETGTWHWELDAIAHAVTDDVAELMSRRLLELDSRTQQVLGVAACVGDTFSLSEMRVLTDSSTGLLTEALWPALVEGLIVPTGGDYREAHAIALSAPDSSSAPDARYQFVHDRVRQAFYSLIGTNQRAATHLRIGRRLQHAYEHSPGTEQAVLELVQHLNAGAAAIADVAEITALARLNLRAARAAKRAGSHALVSTLVEEAQRLLGATAWQDEPELSVELVLERIEAMYMLRDFTQVHQSAQTLLARPLPPIARLAAHELRVRAYLAAGNYAEGERVGLEALEEQGVFYPEDDGACVARALEDFAWIDAWLDEHPDGFSRMPGDDSPVHLLGDSIAAMTSVCAALGTRPALAARMSLHVVRRICERGSLTVIAPFLIAVTAQVRSAFLADYRGAIRWVREGRRAAERLESPLLAECVAFDGNFGGYEHHPESAKKHYDSALEIARASGSFQGTSWALVFELHYRQYWMGVPLRSVAEQERASRELMLRAGDAVGRHIFELTASVVSFLTSSEEPPRVDGDASWLSAGPAVFVAAGDGTAAELARIAEAHISLIFGAPERALEHAEQAERFRPGAFGVMPVTDIPVWRGLAAARCASTAAPERRLDLLAIIEDSLHRMRSLAEGCPQSFGHKLRLLEAERSRLYGQDAEAAAAYEDAIAQAHVEGFVHVEALAAQLCGDHHLTLGRRLSASHFLQRACDAYSRWDARRAVEYLRGRYVALLPALESPPAAATVRSTELLDTTAGAGTASGSATLDIETSIRSAQALASELSPERVVARLMDLVAKNAGAQRAALLLSEQSDDGHLQVVARLDVSRSEPMLTGLAQPLASCADISPAMTELARRSGQALVVADAARDPRAIGEDGVPYSDARSILVAPLIHQGRVAGVLYLEHLAPAAFTSERVTLVSMLASQAVVALENARLYAAQAAHAQQLEQEVAARTRELRVALERLQDELFEAAAYMRALLPRPIPSGGAIATDWLFVPTAELGGDAFDYFWIDERRVAFYVLDVCGHGVGSALLSLAALRAIRSGGLPDADLSDPASVLAALNTAFATSGDADRYFTMWYGVYDRVTLHLRYASAAHPAAVLLEPTTPTTSRVLELDAAGPMLAIAAESTFSCREVVVQPGSRLFLLTDGVFEVLRPDGTFLPYAQVIAQLDRARPRAEVLQAALDMAYSARASTTLDDDFSIVAVDFAARAE